MNRELTVLNGDNINRYGFKFTIGALEGTLFEMATVGVPSLLGHDGHRPIGWNFPIGLYFEPMITKLIGEFHTADSEDDQNTIECAYLNNINNRNISACKPYHEEFLKLLGLKSDYQGNFIYNGCVSYQEKEILLRYHPEFVELQDKDGLIYLDRLLLDFEYLGQGVFKNKKSKFAVFCNRYFRRNLSYLNNFHSYFLDGFVKLNKNSNINLRIALDRDIIGYAPSFNEQFELEYWWGPKYSDDIDKMPLGVTHYECNDRQKLFSGISGTQFWWKRNEREMTLELEELREKPSMGVSNDKYGCRYIHSIYDPENSKFIHFDGAIRMYNEDNILKRWEQPINQAGKGTEYKKLFRIDGKLELSDWKSLITNYFQDNPLLYEYFGLKEEYEKLEKEFEKGKNKSVIETLVPYKLGENAGLKLFVSYHKHTEISFGFERIIINPDIVIRLNDRLDVVEFDILEVKKALIRFGGELIVPGDFSFVKSYDFYANYPTILHSIINLKTNLEMTLRAYLSLFEAIVNKHEACISFTLAWPFLDKEIHLSIYGHISEVICWLKQNQTIPLEHEEFRFWLEIQNKWLSENYEYQNNKPDLFELLRNDGVIYLKREIINPEWIDFNEDEYGLYCKLNIPEGNEELKEEVRNKRLFPTFSSIITKVKCSKTNEDYFNSTTSKFLDNDVVAIIEEASFAGSFWTDKQYY